MNQLTTTILADGRAHGWAELGDPDGMPLVFLHGTPGGRLGVQQHHERFVRQGLRVIAPDRAGYGASDPAPARDVAQVAADVVEVLDACGIDRAVVVGGSGGGPHALAVAAVAPARVRSVGVLVGAAPLRPEEVDDLVDINQRIIAIAGDRNALRELLIPVREVMLRDGLGAVVPDAPDSDREAWARQAESMQRTIDSALEPGVEGMVDDYAAIFADPWGFAASDVTVPVVWAHGRDDRNVPFVAAQRLAAQLPDCRFLTWTDVGHAPGSELLDEFYTAVLGAARHI